MPIIQITFASSMNQRDIEDNPTWLAIKDLNLAITSTLAHPQRILVSGIDEDITYVKLATDLTTVKIEDISK